VVLVGILTHTHDI